MAKRKLSERDLDVFKTRTKAALRAGHQTGRSVEAAMKLSSGSLSRLFSGRRRLTFELVLGIAAQVDVGPLELLTDGAREHFADEISAWCEDGVVEEDVLVNAPPEPAASVPQAAAPAPEPWSEPPPIERGTREERKRKRDLPGRVIRRVLTLVRDIIGL